jgi:hypothetical protein
MAFSSLYIVPNKVLPGLGYAPPVPVNLGFAPNNSLGFVTSDFHSVSHRNWIPYSWDASGSSVAAWNVGGFTAAPTTVSVSNPIISEPVDVFTLATWDKDGFAPVKMMPDFSLTTNPRTMINWWGQGSDGYYPKDIVRYVEGVYPVYWDELGANSTGWYLEATYRLFASIEPYTWEWEGEWYLEQDIRVEVTWRGVPSPGSSPPGGWVPAEGTEINFLGGGATSRGSGTAVGEVRISDQTVKDPNPQWGGMTLWEPNGLTAYPTELELIVVGNHTPRPDYP